DPALIFEAVQTLCGRLCPLPFVRHPVVTNQHAGQLLAAAIMGAFHGTREPLAIDSLIVRLVEGLIAADPSFQPSSLPRHLDVAAVKRAQEYLDAERTRVVRSAELEAVTGLTRYDLARQFRLLHGTSPYRYLLMRRLDSARGQLARHRALAAVAIEAGFADQAHFSRMFKATYGMTPARYSVLQRQG